MNVKLLSNQRVLLIFLLSLLIVNSLYTPKSIEANQTNVSSENKAALMLLSSKDNESLTTIKQLIKSGGGTTLHVFPPNAVIAKITPSLEDTLRKNPVINQIMYSVVDPVAVKGMGDSALFAVESWNNNFMNQAASKGLEVPLGFVEPGPILNDVKTASRGVILNGLASQAPPFGAEDYDTSEYMIGDVSIGIILPESNGGFDPNYETWTPTEKNNVVSEVQNGLNWWLTSADLTFYIHPPQTVQTSLEPILRPSSQDIYWIGEVMENLGYSDSNYYDRVYSYLNDLRDLDGSDWAVAIFVVDSSQDPDGCFSDGYFAYAYCGGPFMVMTYDNDGYGISNMDAVTAHEFGHIFYAADEYYDPGYNDPGYATDTYGYLAIENQNLNGPGRSGTSDVPCIMRGQVAPFKSGSVCSYTRGQVGLRDQDNDGVLDIVDFLPNAVLDELDPDPTPNLAPTFTGYASSQDCYPNSNPRWILNNDITINTITGVSYYVYDSSDSLIRDGQATPIDGDFDSSYESYSFTVLPELDPGYYKVRVNALCSNTLSKISNEDYITIEGLVVTSPNGGEEWMCGMTHAVTWTSTGSPGDFIKIELLKAGVVNLVISSSTENDGSYSWTISPTQILGSDYMIRVTSTTYTAITDTSNTRFAILEGIIITSPNGGDSWVGGTTHEITWTSTGNPLAKVKIELLKAGVVKKVISSSAVNSRSFNWTMPATQALGADYSVRITRTTMPTGSPASSDSSDAFSVIP